MSAAEKVLQGLGITEPSEIDLEAIAYSLGAKVKICALDGCEARIIGYGDKAIIRVSDSVIERRRRFSIAHEIGHWCHHRGQLLICRPEDIGGSAGGARERVADSFAADLVLPQYILLPIIRQYRRFDFKTVRDVADMFKTSLTATARRFVDFRHSPALLICHRKGGRAWFMKSKDVPDRWFPRDELDSESNAFDLLFGQGKELQTPSTIGADAWFDRNGAGSYEVKEQSIRTGPDEILTIVLITDAEMLAEQSGRWR